ncbi:MAG: histidine--tRNA ligase [Actinomycetia bacterium]|nr:histidine--tRNA ligase [Actinomycetes bacterium]
MKIEAPRGTHDVLPADQLLRQAVIGAGESTAARFGYSRITTPTFEETTLFERTSGEGSDVVNKEMYTFLDRGGRSLTLRPEGTASVARAYIERGMHRLPQPVKTFYLGPMFRYAAPQKGRYREFWQIGLEALGSDDPALDAELMLAFVDILTSLGISGVRLQLNSIGGRECRGDYLERLRAFLAEHEESLDEDARRKAARSPLRVFDTKNPALAEVLRDAPKIGDALCAACAAHFESVRAHLDAAGVAYELVPELVRGLDYYTRTVWEFIDDSLDAAQSTLCAGGRYDHLVEGIGGPAAPGVGWAAGIERLELSASALELPTGIDVFLLLAEDVDRPRALAELTSLRRAGLRCETDYASRSMKGQLTHANRLGAAWRVRVDGTGATIERRGLAEVSEVGVAIDRIAERVLAHVERTRG